MTPFDLSGIEVTGQNLLMYLSHMEAETTLPYLEKHGFGLSIDANKWYSAKDAAAFLWDIAGSPDSLYSLVSIGIESIRRLELPPEVEKLPLLDAVNTVLAPYYQSIFRGGYIGFIKGEQVAEKHVKVTCVTPLPDDGWYGTLFGMARRFLPNGTTFSMTYDKDIVRMDNGGSETVIHITW